MDNLTDGWEGTLSMLNCSRLASSEKSSTMFFKTPEKWKNLPYLKMLKYFSLNLLWVFFLLSHPCLPLLVASEVPQEWRTRDWWFFNRFEFCVASKAPCYTWVFPKIGVSQNGWLK